MNNDTSAHINNYWAICKECMGHGKVVKNKRKKIRPVNPFYLNHIKKTNDDTQPQTKANLYKCLICNGTGLEKASSPPIIDYENYPHVAIIGGGIGGVALAVACLHRGIPFTLYERDTSFGIRSQGYGLTLQQASKAIEALGITSLDKGVFSTRHVVHNTDGKIMGEWGIRNLMLEIDQTSPKRKNIHIARQALRLALLDQLGGFEGVKWGHQLVSFKDEGPKGIELNFNVNGKIHKSNADLLVGADGLRSLVRKFLIGDEITPLRYLGCIVILGICPLSNLQGLEDPLLDSATVFQTANGSERIYIMPYDADSIMWQLSFPMLESEAQTLSAKGTKALKNEACIRTQWHSPIPQILASTNESQITGYPVYDRAILTSELLNKTGACTLIGDAAHPMSPFKGQGANQALLDALLLARTISKGCGTLSNWKNNGIRNSVLTEFETEMLKRTANKVNDSAEAAHYLHSEIVLHEGNRPRVSFKNKKDS